MLEAEGWLVLVTVRKEADVQKLSEGRLVPIMFDVTNDAHAQPRPVTGLRWRSEPRMSLPSRSPLRRRPQKGAEWLLPLELLIEGNAAVGSKS